MKSIKYYLKITLLYSLILIITINMASIIVIAGKSNMPFDVTEIPYIRIIYNGNIVYFNEVPIKINGRILLPLRETLTMFNESNDNCQIIWNEKQESVTVIIGKNEMVLKIGSPEVFINGDKYTFEIAPFLYGKNSRTYIPIRTVSELLGKRVMWYDSSSSIYIRSNDEYDETVKIFESIKAQDGFKKIKANIESKLQINFPVNANFLSGDDGDGSRSIIFDMKQDAIYDNENTIKYIKNIVTFNGVQHINESYFLVDRLFFKIDTPGYKWIEITDSGIDNIASQYVSFFKGYLDTYSPSDMAMASYFRKNYDDTFDIVCEFFDHNIFDSLFDDISEPLAIPDLNNVKRITKAQFSVTFDKDLVPLYEYLNISFDMQISLTAGNGKTYTVNADADIISACEYTRLDESFNIEIPGEIKKMLAGHADSRRD